MPKLKQAPAVRKGMSSERSSEQSDRCRATHGVIAVVSPTGKILRHIRMGTTEKFRPVPWGLTVLPLQGSDIVIASIDNEYQVTYG